MLYRVLEYREPSGFSDILPKDGEIPAALRLLWISGGAGVQSVCRRGRKMVPDGGAFAAFGNASGEYG